MLSLQDVIVTYEIARDISETDTINIVLNFQWTQWSDVFLSL